MRAAQVVSLDGPNGVVVHDIGQPPSAGEGQVLLDVHMAGLSFPDLLLSLGQYQVKPDLPFVLGVDFAGEVRTDFPELGYQAGDRVAGWASHGGAAEVVAVDAGHVFPLPDELSFAQGAAMPLNYLTAHFALTVRGQAQPGDYVLVNGAAGGLGSALLQVASGVGCHPIGVVSSDAKAAFAKRMGAENVLTGLAPDAVRKVTGGHGADVVLDVVGGTDLILQSLRCLAAGGRLLSLGYAGGEIPSVKLNRLLLGNIDVRGVAWGPYARANPGFPRTQWEQLLPLVRNGTVRPPLPQVCPLADIAVAMADMWNRHSVGKTVLQVR